MPTYPLIFFSDVGTTMLQIESLKYRVSGIEIKETTTSIIITGIPAYDFARAVMRKWRTNRINKHMFRSISYRRIEMYKFFAVEFAYMLAELAEDRTYSNLIRTFFKEFETRFTNETWLKRTKAPMPSPYNEAYLRDFKLKPLPAQTEAFEAYATAKRSYGLKGFYYALPPGTGKTLASLMTAWMLGMERIIVVCLKVSLVDPWKNTLDNEFTEPPTYWMSTDKKGPTGKERVWVVHYESIEQAIDALGDSIKQPDTFVILDEGHNFNDPNSERTKNFIELCKTSKTNDALWLSGTPLKQMGKEMSSFLRSADPLFTPHVEAAFNKIFVASAIKANEILKRRMGIISFKVDKKTVVDAPEPEIIPIKIQIPNGDRYTLSAIGLEMKTFITERMAYYKGRRVQDMRRFDELIAVARDNMSKTEQRDLDNYLDDVKIISKTKDIRQISDTVVEVNRYELKFLVPKLPREYRTEFKDLRSIIKYTHLKVRGEALGGVLGKKREECILELARAAPLVDWIKGSESKTLIFSSYVSVVEDTAHHLERLGFKPKIAHGGTAHDIGGIIRSFKSDPKVNPIVATYNTLSTAIPIVEASTGIYLNQPFRPHIKDQAISRMYRKGQLFRVRVIDLLLDTGDQPNISTRSLDIMQWSQEIVDAIMGVESKGLEVTMLSANEDMTLLDDMDYEDFVMVYPEMVKNEYSNMMW